MFAELTTPIFSSLLGILGIILLITLTGAMSFLAYLAYLLHIRGWILLASGVVAYSLISIMFPHPSIRSYLIGMATPPLDTIRLGILVFVLVVGLYWIASYLDYEEIRKEHGPASVKERCDDCKKQ